MDDQVQPRTVTNIKSSRYKYVYLTPFHFRILIENVLQPFPKNQYFSSQGAELVAIGENIFYTGCNTRDIDSFHKFRKLEVVVLYIRFA
uniref:Uncharacterized protein n=1 Tax=Megaselia scalaris TaxID=36166 RepID=T1GNB1_MEGSC